MEYAFTTERYSDLRKRRIEPEVIDLVNESCVAFGWDSYVISPRGNWQGRLDQICYRPGDPQRDTLFGYVNGIACSSWQFCFSPITHEAFGEGVFVGSMARGHGVAMKLLDPLLQTFNDLGVERFYVGYPGRKRLSTNVKRSFPAQRFAEAAIGRFNGAVVEVDRTPKGFVRKYALDVKKALRALH